MVAHPLFAPAHPPVPNFTIKYVIPKGRANG